MSGEKKKSAFSESTSYFFHLRYKGTWLPGAQEGDPGREGTHSHPFLSALWNIIWIGCDGGEKKPRLDQGQQLISLSFLTQTHRTAVKEKMALIYLLPLCQRKPRLFKAADKNLWGCFFSSLIPDQSQQPLTSHFRCKFYEAISNKCQRLQPTNALMGSGSPSTCFTAYSSQPQVHGCPFWPAITQTVQCIAME